MERLLFELTGGDRRSIGKSDVVARKVLDDPPSFAVIIGGLRHGDPLVRMRCADVAEKVSLAHPEWLAPYKRSLLDLAVNSTQQELRWHLAQMLPRLKLNLKDRQQVVTIMESYLEDRSSIVKTFAMQALADIATNDVTLWRKLLPLFAGIARKGSPAMRARARKILVQMNDR